MVTAEVLPMEVHSLRVAAAGRAVMLVLVLVLVLVLALTPAPGARA